MSVDQATKSETVEREAARAKAMEQPLRHRIYMALAEREASPAELAEEFGENLHKVSYHVRYLAGKTRHNEYAFIELVGTDRRRGGEMHLYRAIELPALGTGLALPRVMREETSAAIVPKVIADMVGAQEAGTFAAHPEWTLLRQHFRFDDEAMAGAAALAVEYHERLKELAGDAENRLAQNGGDEIPVAMETMIFPVPGLYFSDA